jgi:hypothetical protein
MALTDSGTAMRATSLCDTLRRTIGAGAGEVVQ